MYPDYCLKAMGDARSPCLMIAERCVQATVDASSLREIPTTNDIYLPHPILACYCVLDNGTMERPILMES